MAKIKVYNLEGKESGEVDFDDNIFADTATSALLYQVVRVMRSRQRQPLAHTKDRSDVRGGGKKPWRQKGTGRARHGSIRSPIWKGGGVTFGPRKEGMTKLSIPRKMVKKAIRSVLANKIINNRIFIIDNMSIDKPSSKSFIKLFESLKIGDKKALILSGAEEKNSVLSVRNLINKKSINIDNLNILDLLSFENVLISRQGVEKLSKQLA